MFNNKSFLAVILARGGSKRLPQKNILNLNGKPLVSWSIEAGLKSKYIDKVVVSSDDMEILEISKSCGAEIISRPSFLASDNSTTFDSIKHAIENFAKYDYIILLQPTSPLRDEKHIDEAIELLDKKNADAIISVCEMDHSPLWSNVLPSNKSMMGFLKDEILNVRSQDLDMYYRINGAIYICRVDKLLSERSFFIKENIFAYEMDREVSLDIDNQLDFDFVEFLMNRH
jgi:CMP-N-acetylneuraminic acid synthetase